MIVTLHQSKQEAENDENGINVEIDTRDIADVIVVNNDTAFIRLPKFETIFYKAETWFIESNVTEIWLK